MPERSPILRSLRQHRRFDSGATMVRVATPILCTLAAGIAFALAPPASAQRGGGPTATPSAMRAVPAETTAAAVSDRNWKAPRTSWGDPSFEGVWSTDDMRSVPTQRPRELRHADDADARRVPTTREPRRRRQRPRRESRDVPAQRVGHSHVRLFVARRRSRQRPSSGDDDRRHARVRRTAIAARSATGPFNAFEDFTLYDRCITRGVLGSTLPVIYGNGMRIIAKPRVGGDQLRNDPRHAHHPARPPAALGREHPPMDG